MYKSLTITVIIPCLNEEQGIGKVLHAMPPFVDEVIVVDNGSTDGTAAVAASLGAKVITEELRGYGRAYRRGFAAATGDLIVTLDGDHSYPIDGVSYLLEAFLHLDVDFLNASRFPVRDSRAMSFKHKFGNLVLSLAILEDMKLEADGMAFSEEIKIEAIRNRRIRFGEISILYSTRLGEIKLSPWRDGVQNLVFLVRKRFFR